MLEPEELASMRESVRSTFPDTVVRLRRTLNATPEGGRSATWIEEAPVAGRLLPAEPEHRESDEQLGEFNVQRARVVVTHDVEIEVDDRIRVGSAIFEVVGVRPMRTWDLFRLAQLKQVVELPEVTR